jgi:hypothetical protein
MKQQIFFLFIVISIFCSCGEDTKIEPTQFVNGSEYFPIDVGTEWTYQVDSIHYNSFNTQKPADTFHFWVKETVAEKLPFDSDFETARVERLVSLDSGKSWKFDRSFQLSKSDIHAVKTDWGNRILKLAFPITKNQEWNVNAYNIQEKISGFYEQLFKTIPVKDSIYTAAVSVNLRSVKNLIRTDTDTECYAPKFGMILKERHDLTYKDLEQTQVDGYKVKYSLLLFQK